MDLFKRIFRGAGKLLAIIYPYKANKLLSYFIINYLYVGWIKSEFMFFGKNGVIRRPLFLDGGEFIAIGNNFRTERCLRLEAHKEHNGMKFSPKITIGNQVSINFDCHITAIDRITIGNGVLIASRVFITDHYHGAINSDNLLIPPGLRKLESKGPVYIDDNVWIGEGVCIMPNITIGKGCVIGANSVVTKSFPSNSIIAGNPAKIIKNVN